jgi:hypothetical protein
MYLNFNIGQLQINQINSVFKKTTRSSEQKVFFRKELISITIILFGSLQRPTVA